MHGLARAGKVLYVGVSDAPAGWIKALAEREWN
jgi:hypothetical protein